MNDKRAHYLIEGIAREIVAYLMEDEGLDMAPAIVLSYNSETFARLSDTETGLSPMCTRY